MTLQVALVGTDGIVLASDKLTAVSGSDVPRHSHLTSKLLFDRDQRLAIAHAGHQISETVARSVLSDPALVKERLSESRLESFASEVCNQDELKPYGWRGELIIVSRDDLAHIIHLDMRAWSTGTAIPGMSVRCRSVENKILAGDSLNSAVFFVENYYRREPSARLVFLAAHVILSGGRLNSTGIEGLEIIRCTSQGFERLPDSEVTRLTERSDLVETKIREDLFTPLCVG